MINSKGKKITIGIAVALAMVLALGLGTTQAVHDLNLFELDRDALDSNCGTLPDDWQTLYGNPPGGGTCPGWPDSGFAEAFTGILPDIGADGGTQFTGGGSKDNNDISQWLWKAGEPLDKDDITNAYSAAYTYTGPQVCEPGFSPPNCTEPGDSIIFFGLDRFSTAGDAQVGFWFFQNPIGLTNISSQGGFEFSGVHEVGDVLVQSNFTNGGAVESLSVFKWVGSGGSNGALDLVYTGADCVSGGTTAPLACATVNQGPTVSPWPYTPKANEGSPGTFQASAFFEGGINLTRLIPNVGCFSTVVAETRSSTPFDAVLKDFVLGNFDLCSIVVDKAGDTLSKVGDPVDYTITITNTGSLPLYKDDISDTLLGAITTDGVDQSNPYLLTNTCGASLAVGASCTITLRRTVQASDPDPLVNTVTVTYRGKSDLSGTAITTSDDHSVNLFQPAVTIAKTGPALSKVGDTVTYTFTITNTSSQDSPNLTLASISDSVIGNLMSQATAAGCDVLTYQEVCSFSVSRTVQAGDPDPLVNTVNVLYHPDGFPNDITASASHSVNLFQPSVKITKTGPAFSKAGDTATYNVTIQNTSSADSPNLVLASFSDSVVAGVTPPASCSPLAPGASCSFSYTYTVQAGDPDPLVNTATAHYHPVGFTNDITASSTWTTDLLHPGFTVSKACKTNTEPIPQAGPAVFTITFNNTGDADMHVVPSEGAPFDVAAGTSFSYDYTVNGPFNSTASNTVTGNVTLAGKYGLSNSYTFTASGSCTVEGKAKVIKTVNGQPPAAGQTFTFQLREGASTLSDGTILEQQDTDATGNISFVTSLVPSQHYQLCELVFPGWNTSLDSNLFVPNSIIPPSLPNPNVNNLTVCTDFVAQAGQTTTFTVDNTPPPGGRALTIGFWKNWASCANNQGKGQDPVLDQTLAIASSVTTDPPGGLVVSAQNLGGGLPNFAPAYYLVLEGDPNNPDDAPSCEEAVNLLNKSTATDGKKKASDPLFNMAAQLIGAELNYFAGAGINGTTIINIGEAVVLLGKYQFNGDTYNGKLTSADAALAKCLATQLDNYNNNNNPVVSCP